MYKTLARTEFANWPGKPFILAKITNFGEKVTITTITKHKKEEEVLALVLTLL